MSTVKANNIQIGQSATATQNFTLAVPATPDGTIKLSRGNQGATTADVVSIDALGNIGVGTTSPSSSAILDVQSTTKGIRFPNMTTTQKNAIASPGASLTVFDTTLGKLCFYTGSAWQTITSA